MSRFKVFLREIFFFLSLLLFPLLFFSFFIIWSQRDLGKFKQNCLCVYRTTLVGSTEQLQMLNVNGKTGFMTPVSYSLGSQLYIAVLDYPNLFPKPSQELVSLLGHSVGGVAKPEQIIVSWQGGRDFQILPSWDS